MFDCPASLSTHDRLLTAIQWGSITTLPKRPKPEPHWYQESIGEIAPAIKQRNQAMSAMFKQPQSKKLRREIQHWRREVKSKVKTAKNGWISDMCNRVDTRNGKEAWNAVKKLQLHLSKPKSKPPIKLKRPNGSGVAESPHVNATILLLILRTIVW